MGFFDDLIHTLNYLSGKMEKWKEVKLVFELFFSSSFSSVFFFSAFIRGEKGFTWFKVKSKYKN